MHESTDGKSKSNDDPIPDSHFAELERAAERRRECGPAIEPTSIEEEYFRNFAIIDEIAAPIRKAITQFTTPPTLPDYGPLEEIGRGGMGVVYRAKITRRTASTLSKLFDQIELQMARKKTSCD